MKKTSFILVSCNEITTIDIQSWLFLHVYINVEWVSQKMWELAKGLGNSHHVNW
jgi:hypothetical protein